MNIFPEISSIKLILLINYQAIKKVEQKSPVSIAQRKLQTHNNLLVSNAPFNILSCIAKANLAKISLMVKLQIYQDSPQNILVFVLENIIT